MSRLPYGQDFRLKRLNPFRAVLYWALCVPAFAGSVQDPRTVDLRGVNTHYSMRDYVTRQQWEARKADLRTSILTSAGLNPLPPKTPLKPQYTRHIENEFSAIDTVLIETMPGFYLGGNVYRPLKPKPGMPAVLVPHGHWKKGRVENLPEYSVPALAMNLARQGYVVFAYDMVGYNDTTQLSHDFASRDNQLWSFTPLGIQLWDSIRALDFLLSLDGVDSNRVAITGASGGGTQTFLLTAIDDRINVSAPVNMISAYMQGGDPCEEAPGLRVDTFNVEIAAMMAPRPMLVISCTKDWTKHTPEEEFPALQSIYKLYDRKQLVQNQHFDAEHNYNARSREAVYRFLARQFDLPLSEAELKDREISAVREADFLAFPNADHLKTSLTAEQLFQEWKNMSREQTEQVKDKEVLRARLRSAMRVEFPETVNSDLNGNEIGLRRLNSDDRINGFWRSGKRNPVLIVSSGGIAAARSTKMVKELIETSRPVLILEPFTPSLLRTQAALTNRNFFSYNRSDDAIRVQDVLIALSFLKANASGNIEVIALGSAGIASLFAAAVAPVETELLIDLDGFAGTDENFREEFFIPGIQRAGGLQAALRLTSSVRTVAKFISDSQPNLLPVVPRGIRGRRR